MSGKPVAFDLFEQGSAPRGLWQEIATSLNAAATHGSEVIQLHMGAVIQRARLLVFRSVAPEATGPEPSYGWGATLILATRTGPDLFEEAPLNYFVADDDEDAGGDETRARTAVEEWVHRVAVEHFCQVAAVAGWQTQWFSHEMLRGVRSEPLNVRLARRIVAAADERLAALRVAADETGRET